MSTDLVLRKINFAQVGLSQCKLLKSSKQNSLPRVYIVSQKDVNISVLRIRIRDPGLGAFLTPGSGIRDG